MYKYIRGCQSTYVEFLSPFLRCENASSAYKSPSVHGFTGIQATGFFDSWSRKNLASRVIFDVTKKNYHTVIVTWDDDVSQLS